MNKEVLMIRLGNQFCKEKVTDIKIADFRTIQNGKKKEYETDYLFKFNGKHYRSNEYICKKENGQLIKPICFKHELICLN